MELQTLLLIIGGTLSALLLLGMLSAVMRSQPSVPEKPLWPPRYFLPQQERPKDGPPTGQFRIPTASTGIAASKPAGVAPAETGADATHAFLAAAPRPRPVPVEEPVEDTSRKQPAGWDPSNVAATRVNPVAVPPTPDETRRVPSQPRGVKVDDRTNIQAHSVASDGSAENGPVDADQTARHPIQ